MSLEMKHLKLMSGSRRDRYKNFNAKSEVEIPSLNFILSIN